MSLLGRLCPSITAYVLLSTVSAAELLVILWMWKQKKSQHQQPLSSPDNNNNNTSQQRQPTTPDISHPHTSTGSDNITSQPPHPSPSPQPIITLDSFPEHAGKEETPGQKKCKAVKPLLPPSLQYESPGNENSFISVHCSLMTVVGEDDEALAAFSHGPSTPLFFYSLNSVQVSLLEGGMAAVYHHNVNLWHFSSIYNQATCFYTIRRPYSTCRHTPSLTVFEKHIFLFFTIDHGTIDSYEGRLFIFDRGGESLREVVIEYLRGVHKYQGVFYHDHHGVVCGMKGTRCFLLLWDNNPLLHHVPLFGSIFDIDTEQNTARHISTSRTDLPSQFRHPVLWPLHNGTGIEIQYDHDRHWFLFDHDSGSLVSTTEDKILLEKVANGKVMQNAMDEVCPQQRWPVPITKTDPRQVDRCFRVKGEKTVPLGIRFLQPYQRLQKSENGDLWSYKRRYQVFLKSTNSDPPTLKSQALAAVLEKFPHVKDLSKEEMTAFGIPMNVAEHLEEEKKWTSRIGN